MKLTDFNTLTFDCYGTLIDWESGIFTALQPLLAKSGNGFARDAALEAFARHESAQEHATPDMIYSDLLAQVHARLAREWGIHQQEARDQKPDLPTALDQKLIGRDVFQIGRAHV